MLRSKLDRALRLYIKKWRASKQGIRPDVLQIGSNHLGKVVKIQNFARRQIIGKNIRRR